MAFKDYMLSCVADCKCKGELKAKSDAERLTLKLAEKMDETLFPKAVNVVSVKEGNTKTVTTTYADGTSSVAIVTVDEKDRPISVIEDGVECKITWIGYD